MGVVLTLGFVYTLKQFDLIWTLTQGGPGNASQLMSTWSYTLSFVNNSFGSGAAVADFLFAISLVVVAFYALRNRKQHD
jgi:multiple sugar transport system permease protein